jgi:hypothetical protein
LLREQCGDFYLNFGSLIFLFCILWQQDAPEESRRGSEGDDSTSWCRVKLCYDCIQMEVEESSLTLELGFRSAVKKKKN